jgi:succinate dehydrogenase / fumarate reductase cytochrome b subunit
MLGFLKSNILSKIVVAVTGLILVGFILVHTMGNLLVYAGPNAINAYAIGLRDLGGLLWLARIVLVVAAILHIITTIKLVRHNKQVAGHYKVYNYKAATFSGRFMAYAGIAIFFFVLCHLAQFTWGWVDSSNYAMETTLPDGRAVHDVYTMVILGFRNAAVSLFYVIAVIFLGLHLKHGIHSMFQTLGIHGKKFTPLIQKVATILSFIIVISLISIPISVMLGLVGGQV